MFWIKLQNKKAHISRFDAAQFIVCILEEPERLKRVFRGFNFK
jgi:hypothetical protein